MLGRALFAAPCAFKYIRQQSKPSSLLRHGFPMMMYDCIDLQKDQTLSRSGHIYLGITMEKMNHAVFF